jgi:DNA ligase OB-like domain
MPTHDNTKNLPFLPPVLNKYDEERLMKEAHKLGSSYFIGMPKHDGGMVIFLKDAIELPGRGSKPSAISSVCTRQGMLIPNVILRSYLEYLNSEYGLHNMIGEIHSSDEILSHATSIISDEKVKTIKDNIRLTLFNYYGEGGFAQRYEYILQTADSITNGEDRDFVRAVQTYALTHPRFIIDTYARLQRTFPNLEGMVITHENAPYVGGVRGKVNPHSMKYVELESGEYEVVGVVERMYGKESKSVPEELRGTPKGDLGALICKMPDSDLTFQVGVGFTDQQRKDYWTWRKPNNSDELLIIGKYAWVEYQDIGSKGKPTKPRFRGWRSGPSGDIVKLEGN